ncbi:flagellar basal body rod protein FlgB [Deltaproteobacteria bacterium Smac51]|nr:flagellar basal body rod protein FlgB [Deltaproteobacteria bacterium Smac51]
MAINFQNSLFGGKINNMTGTLGLRLARHDMSATNLANMDTPGFRAKHLNFEKVLAQQLMSEPGKLEAKATDAGHIPTKDPGRAFARANNSVKYSPYGWDEYDDDILDIDKEMTLLTKNQLIYNTTVQMLAKSFEGLKEAMGSGGA